MTPNDLEIVIPNKYVRLPPPKDYKITITDLLVVHRRHTQSVIF
jgi:hypothetical protein